MNTRIAAMLFVIAAIIAASTAWGWWGFGIAIAIAVAIAIVSSTNRNASTTPAAGAAPAAPAAGGKKPTALDYVRNIGAILATVVFGIIVLSAIALLRDCGGAIADGARRLDEVASRGDVTTPPDKPAPTAVTVTSANVPANQRIQVDFSGRTIFPAGTEVAFYTEGCGTWKYRGVTPAQDKDPSWNKTNPWITAGTDNEGFVLTRQSWIEVKAEKPCRMGFQIVQLGPTVKI
jgi:hypothetical protein